MGTIFLQGSHFEFYTLGDLTLDGHGEAVGRQAGGEDNHLDARAEGHVQRRQGFVLLVVETEPAVFFFTLFTDRCNH